MEKLKQNSNDNINIELEEPVNYKNLPSEDKSDKMDIE